MRLTPPFTDLTSHRDYDSLSFRQLHALCEAADADLRGFAPSQESLVVLTIAEEKLQVINRRRKVSDRCACVWCVEPFPDPDPYEV